MRHVATIILTSTLALALVGCARQTASSSAAGTTEAASAASDEGTPPPADSPLAKIHKGMPKKEVSNILGMPSDENSYLTGKAFIPFYFGNDARRTAWYYKGMGQVIFADGNVFGGGAPEVIQVNYDPNEPGVAR